MGRGGGATRFETLEERDDSMLLEFVDEAADQLDRVEQALLAYEQNPEAREQLAAALRSLHSLKGSAAYVALFDIQELCHSGEEVIGTLDRASAPLARRMRLDLVLDAVPILRDRLDDVRRCCEKHRELRPDEPLTDLIARMRLITSAHAS